MPGMMSRLDSLEAGWVGVAAVRVSTLDSDAESTRCQSPSTWVTEGCSRSVRVSRSPRSSRAHRASTENFSSAGSPIGTTYRASADCSISAAFSSARMRCPRSLSRRFSQVSVPRALLSVA